MSERTSPLAVSEDEIWNGCVAVITDILDAEVAMAQRTNRGIQLDDEGSYYPSLIIGPEVVPEPGSTDYRLMTPPGSPAYTDAIEHPQSAKQYLGALEIMASLRPSNFQDR